ncbi:MULTISPECIES: hypothetical protein [Halocynthiibacter]|uniref:Uncharacterized protein n=1 Tax=Halocynthiibacter halioticoli TaxID=2986804 RepID=A0AAE3LRR0_9RHOB|nr:MULTISPECIES: hypothetical protein [Halocynthiibacter]MCV6824878.1 hypothetical protein [Halocynthiibacter halioticoli]MCW4057879.1 hypothetical protein [Halocynthiibacter sp. SDUM655004]
MNMRQTSSRNTINKPTDSMLDREFEEIADRQRFMAILFSLGAAAFVAWASLSREEATAFYFGLIGAVLFLTVGMMKGSKARQSRTKCNEYRARRRQLEDLFKEEDPSAIECGIRQLKATKLAPHLSKLVEAWLPPLYTRLEEAREQKEIERTRLEKMRRRESVLKATAQIKELAKAKICQSRKSHPVLAARDAAIQRLARVKARRVQLEADVDEMLECTSWWTKLTYDYPDYNKMDKEIRDFERDVRLFLSRKADIIREAEEKHDAAVGRIDVRLRLIEENVMGAIPDRRQAPFDGDTIIRNSLILSALSVPVSAWQDISQAGEVYDALRSVNGNFEGMSDSEIWLQTLTMEPQSLAGLASLTKGALFEAHVATSTGGTLHEHFNTPDTDIVIDGVEFQVKATDSASYIESVDTSITVIATSEVAAETGAIDGGMSNAELDNAMELALGGSVVDFPDTAMDAVIGGFGGLGVFATLRGINHAIDRHREGIDKVEAIEEGIGVAVTGTMKATVDIAEMGYKVATSRPSRFLGRQVVKAGKGIGRAIEAAEERGREKEVTEKKKI